MGGGAGDRTGKAKVIHTQIPIQAQESSPDGHGFANAVTHHSWENWHVPVSLLNENSRVCSWLIP